jgi:hypothetical protein
MTTFHSQQPNCARRAHKQANASTLNFTSQIAQSICTVMHTKRVKPDAAIFKSRCSRTVVGYRLDRVHALPLVWTRFLRLANRSPMIQRSPARRSRIVRKPSGKTSGEMSRRFSHNFPAMVGQWQMQCHQISARQLARQLAICRATSTPYTTPQPMQHPAKHLAR